MRFLFEVLVFRLLVGLLGIAGTSLAQEAVPAAVEATPRPMYLREFRVIGSKTLTSAEIGEIVYPFLGPGRLPSDVDRARGIGKGLS